MRVIIPPTGNEVISMLKNTSLVSVLGYTELLYSVQIIYARNYQTIPLLIVACIWYMVLTSILYLVPGLHRASLLARSDARQSLASSCCGSGRAGERVTTAIRWWKRSACASRSAVPRCCVGIDLEVKRGEVFCIVGPSGSGKSTFLRCINHLERVNAGRLSVDGELVGYRRKGDKLYELREKEIAHKRAEIGMVFQRFNLFPHMTALGNIVEGPLRVKREPKTEVRERAQHAARPRRPRRSRRRVSRASSRAASSSGSRSPGRWRCGRS